MKKNYMTYTSHENDLQSHIDKLGNQINILYLLAGIIFGGTIFVGMLLSNWLGGTQRQISDSLRLVVLAALFPTVLQFTNILIYDESSFTLIPPLLAGLAITFISATILFKKYRKHKDQESVS